MSDSISIKVQIANRTYPLKVKASQEEAILKAVRLIKERIEGNEKEYAVKDPQDLLAMCCLQLATEQMEVSFKTEGQLAEINKELENLSALVNAVPNLN